MNFVSVDLQNHRQLDALDLLFQSVPNYMQTVYGRVSSKHDAMVTFTKVPPQKSLSDKFIFSLFDGDDMLACVDLIRGYPNSDTAFVGLLLVAESRQHQGIGRTIFTRTETIVARWSGVNKMRLAVAVSNSAVLGFWENMGFRQTGELACAQEDDKIIECVMLEKRIVSTRRRYSMRCDLDLLPPKSDRPARRIEHSDVPALARLMEASYRNTIDDEGENHSHYTHELRETMSGFWGTYCPDASFCIEDNGKIIAATLVTLWKERPLLAQCMTAPQYRGRGAASQLIRMSMNALYNSGWVDLTLGVTRGNDDAERLYRRLGFVEIPPS